MTNPTSIEREKATTLTVHTHLGENLNLTPIQQKRRSSRKNSEDDEDPNKGTKKIEKANQKVEVMKERVTICIGDALSNNANLTVIFF